MENQFIGYELSLKLKVLGFDQECLGVYDNGSKELLLNDTRELSIKDLPTIFTLAPLYQQAFDFIREKYGKNAILFSDGHQWTFDLRWIDEDDIMQYPSTQFPKKEVGREMFDTYQEAREKA